MIALLAFGGLFFIFLEFLLPSTLMAIVGTLMLLSSLSLFYVHIPQISLFLAYMFGLGIATALTIYLGLKRIRKSKVLHTSDQEGFQACEYPKEMIGRLATVISDLKPSGYVEIDGRSFAALSKLGYIEKGMTVRVIGGQGTHLIIEEKIHAENSTAAR